MDIQLRIELIRDGMTLNDDSYENQHQTTAASSLIKQVKARREALGLLKAHLCRTLDLPQNGDFAFDVRFDWPPHSYPSLTTCNNPRSATEFGVSRISDLEIASTKFVMAF
jgi:hypothetical protein